MKYIQTDAYRFALRGRYTRGKHVLVNDTTAGGIARSCYRRKCYFPRFPPKRMCVETRRHPKGNKVSWNVVRLNDIIHVGILKVPQRPSSTSNSRRVLSVPTPSQVISVRRAEGSR